MANTPDRKIPIKITLSADAHKQLQEMADCDGISRASLIELLIKAERRRRSGRKRRG